MFLSRWALFPKFGDRWMISCRICCALGLFISLLFTGCHRNEFDVPVLSTAEEQYDLAIEQYNEYSSPLNQISRYKAKDEAILKAMLRKRKRLFEITVASYQQVISAFPGEEKYVRRSRLSIAMIRNDYGYIKQALDDFRALIEDYPTDDVVQVESLFFAAQICDRYNKSDEAKGYYQEIINRFADHKGQKFRHRVETSRYLYGRVRLK